MIECTCNGPWCAICGPRQQRVPSVVVPVHVLTAIQAENERLKGQLREVCEAVSWFSESQEWDSILDGPMYHMLANMVDEARNIINRLKRGEQ